MNTFKSTYNDFKEQYELTGDYVADNETWAAYVDGIVKSGELTHLHWKYLPNLPEIETWEEVVTDESYLIDALGIKMVFQKIDSRPDRLMCSTKEDKGNTHYHVTIMRGEECETIYFSQGSAYKELPTMESVLYCLLTDYNYSDLHIEDMDDLGYDMSDPYDRKAAEKTLKVVVKNSKKLRKLLSKQEIEDLQIVFGDY